MFCPNCGKEVVEEAIFCPYCRTKIKIDNVELINTNNTLEHNNNKNKNTKLPKIIILLLIPILLISVIIFTYNKLKDINKKIPIEQITDKEEDQEEYNSLEKINKDYENKTISVNEYFTQLVYLAYSQDNLDDKYESDNEDYYTEDQLELPLILEKHYEELDKDIVDFYLANALMTNVHIGKIDPKVEKQSNNNKDYKVTRLKGEDNDKSLPINHYLDKAYLSSNGNFIIWYTQTGDDSIEEKDVLAIANGLESSIGKYKNIFGMNYSYSPYIEPNKSSKEWTKAKEVLANSQIDESKIETAMNVYVFDTGSKRTLATYIDEALYKKLINPLFHSLESDGYLAYPLIRINKQGIKGIDSLTEVYNHELFHHLQVLYCRETTDLMCRAGNELIEGMANFASSIASDVSSRNAFLNGWAGVYRGNPSKKLSLAGQGSVVGYATYLYFYTYYKNVNNGFSTLMSAHNEKDSYAYIQNNTPKEELIKTINNLAYRTLNQEFELNTLFANSTLGTKGTINEQKEYDYTIYAGAIDYFYLLKNISFKVETSSDFVTIKLFGYKNNIYEEVESKNNSFEFNWNNYKEYDKFYLALTNANLIEDYNYTISAKKNNETDDITTDSEYKTSFDNYNIEIDMTTKASGVEVTQHSKGVVDELHQKEYLENDTSTMEMVISTKVYTDFVTGYSYTSQPFSDDVWLKDKGASQIVDLKVILEKLKDKKNVETIANNHFKIKLDKKDMQAMMKSANTNTSALNGDVEIDVYTENDYITKLEYDFTKMIKGFDLFKTTISFSNYNNAGDVEIPSSVINNAK